MVSLATVYLPAIENADGPDYRKSHGEIGRYFRRYINPRFGTLVAEDLDAEAVRPRLAEIQAQHGDRTADLTHAYLSGQMSWGMRLPAARQSR